MGEPAFCALRRMFTLLFRIGLSLLHIAGKQIMPTAVRAGTRSKRWRQKHVEKPITRRKKTDPRPKRASNHRRSARFGRGSVSKRVRLSPYRFDGRAGKAEQVTTRKKAGFSSSSLPKPAMIPRSEGRLSSSIGRPSSHQDQAAALPCSRSCPLR